MGQAPKKLYPAAAVLIGTALGLFVVWLLVSGPLSGDGGEPAPSPPGDGRQAGKPMSALAERGAELFDSQGCTTCHTVDGTPGIGPSLLGVWGTERRMDDGSVVVVDAAYVRESIVDPMAKIVEGYLPSMTNYSWLSEEDVEALTAYIEWLGR